MDIEEVAEQHPGKNPPRVRPSAGRPAGLSGAQALPQPRPQHHRPPVRPPAALALQALHRVRLLDGRNQPGRGHHRRPRLRAGCEVQLRRQRALPPSGDLGDARQGRGRPARSRRRRVRSELHRPRWKHRLPRQRRRPRHGHHGHHQALRRRSGELPRRRAVALPRSRWPPPSRSSSAIRT